jgi:uncharacterized membrane protein YccC
VHHTIQTLGEVCRRELLQFRPPRWRDLAPATAARVALGVAVPLVLGVATGRLRDGVFAALGASLAGNVSFQGATRTRFEAVALASFGMAVSTFVGATVAAWPWLLPPMVGLWAYLTGLSVVLGKRWSAVALAWTFALLVGISIPLQPGPAATRAALALAGGLLQAVLVALSWALRPGGEERTALAASYTVLARYAAALAQGRAGAPSPADFPATAVLQDPNPLLPVHVRWLYRDLLEEAVRLRGSLAALAAYVDEASPAQSERIRAFATAAGSGLERIALGLAARPGEWATRAADARRRISELSVPVDAGWRWAGEGVLGQLRAVSRTLSRVDGRPGVLLGAGPRVDPALSRSGSLMSIAVATLRANATPATEAGRHALRLAVAAGLAELVTQALRYPLGRWGVLTVLVVLRPDYTSTVSRFVQRAVGTLLGAALALGFVDILHPDRLALSLATGVVSALAYVTFDAYLLFSLFGTAFVLLIFDLLGMGTLHTAEARLGASALGAAWALVVYLAWPTWEGVGAPEKFAVMLEKHGAYMASLLHQLAHPESRDEAQLLHEQERARQARSDAEAAAERLSQEPSHPMLTVDLARGLIAIGARVAHGVLAAHALVEQREAARAGTAERAAFSAGLDALANALGSAMQELASALRAQAPPGPIPALRPLHAQLKEHGATDATVLVVTDALVDAVGSLDALLRRDAAAATVGVDPYPSGAGTPHRLG